MITIEPDGGEVAGTLRVDLDVRGLEPGKLHVHYIHGFVVCAMPTRHGHGHGHDGHGHRH